MFQVRPATREDAAAIAELSGQLGYPVDEVTLGRRLTAVAGDRRHAVFVAEERGGVLLGWIHIMPKIMLVVSEVCEVGGLVVDERHRRRGVGRALVEAATAWAGASGYRVITVRSDTRREESRAFYPALGFEAVKEQRVYRRPLS